MLEIDQASLDRIAHAARFLAVQVCRGTLDYTRAINIVARAAQCSARYRHLSDDDRDGLENFGVLEFDAALHRPELAASHDIRFAIAPLMSQRTPRAEILLAAYRAADGRIGAEMTESIVRAEIAAFMARVRIPA